MRRAIKDIVKSLSRRDVEALRSIYFFRCLTESQLLQSYTHNTSIPSIAVTESMVERKIEEFVAYGLIEPVEQISSFWETKNRFVYFLTSLGIELLRYVFDFPTNIYDAKKKVAKRGYYRASELKMNLKNINHQVHLNQFVLDFVSKMPDVTWKYYDEKYVSQFANIRPDGMLTILDTDFFLEMDMATESKRQLTQKWENYRNFLNSREYAYKERKIVVFFIVDGTTQIKERIDLIKYTAYEHIIDLIDADFDMYIGTKSTLLDLLINVLIPEMKGNTTRQQRIQQLLTENHHFDVSSGYSLKKALHGAEHEFYIRKMKDQKHILSEDHRLQEFIVDDYTHSPISVLNKIVFLEQRNVFFKNEFHREITYVVIVNNEESIYKDLKLIDFLGADFIFFTTLNRLERYPWYRALFQLDALGNVYHFVNAGLEERVYESSVSIL